MSVGNVVLLCVFVVLKAFVCFSMCLGVLGFSLYVCCIPVDVVVVVVFAICVLV